MSEVEVIILVSSGTFVILLLVAVFFWALFINNKKKNLYSQNLLSLQSHFSETLLQSQLEIQEQTLQQVSRELHDNLGQIASLIKINLNTLQLSDTVKASEKVEATKTLIRQLLTDLKALSVNLGSDRLTKLGLIGVLQTEVENLNKTGEFTAQFIGEGEIADISSDKAIILYRMAQEILNNAAKHSGASLIKVQVSFSENLFILAIIDNGVGFDVAEKIKNGGAGLTNLYNRAKLINATLTISSQPLQGTNISIQTAL